MVYNSADVSRATDSIDQAAEFRRKHKIPQDRSLVVQVSWIIPEKGVSDLLAAARLVIDQNPNVHFAFVGEGAYRLQYQRQSDEMDLRDHVTFTGQIEDPMNEGVYSAADIVCQVSRWEEVFGYVIAEAMVSSKPMLATRVGGIPELVENGRTGFLVNRGDAQAMAERILALAINPELRVRMGRAGREAARAKFDLQRNVEKVVKLYGVAAPKREPIPQALPSVV